MNNKNEKRTDYKNKTYSLFVLISSQIYEEEDICEPLLFSDTPTLMHVNIQNKQADIYEGSMVMAILKLF